jgi:hypothetical protein
MYLKVLAQRARVPLRRQRDGWAERPFPADFGPAGAGFCPPGSTLNFSMLFLNTILESLSLIIRNNWVFTRVGPHMLRADR